MEQNVNFKPERNWHPITSNQEIKNTKEYKIIVDILNEFCRTQAFVLGTGHCIGMSQMIQSALRLRGIESELMEVYVAISYNQFNPPQFTFVGYDEISAPNEIDTHVVVVTKTKVPILIDGSIANRLPPERRFVVDAVTQTTNGRFTCETESPEFMLKLIYEERPQRRMAGIIQESFLHRAETDYKIFQTMSFLKTLNIIGITLSMFSLINILGKIFNWF